MTAMPIVTSSSGVEMAAIVSKYCSYFYFESKYGLVLSKAISYSFNSVIFPVSEKVTCDSPSKILGLS